MQTQTTESLQELSEKLMGKAIARATISNNQMHDGLRLVTNTETEELTRFKTFQFISVFGSYFIQQKILSAIKPQDRDYFKKIMREQYGKYTSAIYYHTGDKDFLEEILRSYDVYFKTFSDTVGNISTTLQKMLVLGFNARSKIKFIDNSVKGKFKFSLVNTLLKTGYKAKIENGVVSLPISVSEELASAITKDFLGLEV